MKTLRKPAAIILCVCMLLSMTGCGIIHNVVKHVIGVDLTHNEITSVPSAAPTASPTSKPTPTPEPEDDDIYYFIDGEDGTASFVEYEGHSRQVEVPAEYNGAKVTSIYEDAFAGNGSVTSAILPDTVDYMGKRVFKGCKNLRSVKLPKFLYEIDDETFFETSLTELEIPDTVTFIGESAFEGCGKLKEVEIPESVISLHSRAFARCTRLEKITVPPTVTSVPDDVFDDCPDLTIYGFSYSEAERCANANNIPFVSIGALATPTPTPTKKPEPTPKPNTAKSRTYTESEYGNSITINPDGTYSMTVNLYEGYGTVYGTYRMLSDTLYEFSVSDRDFWGFIGDDVYKFWMSVDGSVLVYGGETIGACMDGMVFR